MECCQVVRSASRSMRQASLLHPTRSSPSPSSSSLLVRQQKRFQSSAPPSGPNRSAIDELLATRRNAAPISRPSILSSPRGAGLSSILPPRPQRAGGPRSSQSPNNNNTNNNPSADPFSLVNQIEQNAAKFGQATGVKRNLFSWSADDFKQKWGIDKVEDIRLSPSVGRIVHVTNNVDVRVALARVNKSVSGNGIRNMSMAQRSHERPALRRKRKLREAWRSRFRKGFKAVVNRAMELRRQGW